MGKVNQHQSSGRNHRKQGKSFTTGDKGKEPVVKISWEKFATSFSVPLFDYQKCGFLADAVIFCDEEQFQCHRLVLCCSSYYFEKIIKVLEEKRVKDGDTRQKEVYLVPGIGARMMSHLIHCMYQGWTLLPTRLLDEFWKGAALLELKGFCESQRTFYGSLNANEIGIERIGDSPMPLKQTMSVDGEIIEDNKDSDLPVLPQFSTPTKKYYENGTSEGEMENAGGGKLEKCPALDLVELVQQFLTTATQQQESDLGPPVLPRADLGPVPVPNASKKRSRKNGGGRNTNRNRKNKGMVSKPEFEGRKHNLDEAIAFAVKTESIMQACRKYGIPKSTLASNLKKRGLMPLRKNGVSNGINNSDGIYDEGEGMLEGQNRIKLEPLDDCPNLPKNVED